MRATLAKIEKWESQRKIGKLSKQLKERDRDILTAAYMALTRIASEKISEAAQVLKEYDEACLSAVEQYESAKDLARLVAALDSPSPDAGDAASEALRRIGEPAVETVLEALKNRDKNHAYLHLRTLAEIGGERVIRFFVGNLKRGEGNVVEFKALQQAGWKPPEEDPELLIWYHIENEAMQLSPHRELVDYHPLLRYRERIIDPMIRLLGNRGKASSSAFDRCVQVHALMMLTELSQKYKDLKNEIASKITSAKNGTKNEYALRIVKEWLEKNA